MPEKKQKIQKPKQPKQEFIIDEFDIERDDGTIIHVKLDASTLVDIGDRYKHRLLAARDMVINPDAPDLRNSLVKKCYDQAWADAGDMPEKTKQEKDRKARYVSRVVNQHLQTLLDQAQYEGFILASIADKANIFPNAPEPYDEDENEEELPGLGSPLPKPVRDLSNPVEVRLKQFMDFLVSVPGAFNQYMSSVENVAAKAYQFAEDSKKKDQNGFRP